MASPHPRKPEILAPAGDRDALEAAVRAGADAVYFGLQGFNARARATNFDAAELGETMRWLHEHGVRGLRDAQHARLRRRAAERRGRGPRVRRGRRRRGDRAGPRRRAARARDRARAPHPCLDADDVHRRLVGRARARARRDARDPRARAVARGHREDASAAPTSSSRSSCTARSASPTRASASRARPSAGGARTAARARRPAACPTSSSSTASSRTPATARTCSRRRTSRASALVPDLVRARRVVAQDRGAPQGPRVRRRHDAALSRGDRRGDRRRASRPPRTSGARRSRPSRAARARASSRASITSGSSRGARAIIAGSRSARSARSSRSAGARRSCVELAADLARGDGILVEGGFASEGEIGGRVWALAVGGRDVERAHAGDDGARVARARRAARQRARQDGARERAARVPHERSRGGEEDPDRARARPRARGSISRIAGRVGEPFVLEGRTAAGALRARHRRRDHRAGALGAARRGGAAREARQARRLAVRARLARRRAAGRDASCPCRRSTARGARSSRRSP